MDSGLFDAAISHLFNIPETMERLVFPSNHQHGGVHENGKVRVQGEGRNFSSAPTDVLETPKEYTFFLDVPGLSKSDIQALHRLDIFTFVHLIITTFAIEQRVIVFFCD
jgi:HSP20 family protein